MRCRILHQLHPANLPGQNTFAGTIALPESGTTNAAGTAFSVTTTNGTGTPIAIEGTATGANLNFSYATSLAR
jgi:hypothetical protein